MATNRGSWGSRLGFILAAAGSAVGLGNVWGFPTQVGKGGGAVFVLVYLVCVFVICLPVMIAELVIGRRAQKDPVSAFSAIRPNSPWWLVGALGVAAGVAILSFYSVIAGWAFAYVWFSASGASGGDPAAIRSFFAAFVANGPASVLLSLLVLTGTAAAIIGGVRGGIERVCKVMMPLLLLLLVGLAIRATTLPGAHAGLAYYFKPDLARLFEPAVLNAALGQAFFSLSLGMGAMLTYGSYLSKRDGIAAAALWVVVIDTTVALLAGLIIFPAGFSIPGFDPGTSGPGLIFAVLPQLFATLPGGHVFGAAFFVMLSLAALTSTISLLEVPVAHLIDARGWTRRRAVITLASAAFLLSIPSALAGGSVAALSQLPGLGMDFLSLMATIWNNFALPVGGLFIAVFVGWAWGVEGALDELRANQAWFPGPRVWGFLIRFVCPLAILVIIVFTIRDLL
ncbi:MAG: sodium-dependent transporter [Vicinamibacterales bacterium]|nr:sodium-dependent transporter [Vicinamibacterales bacterium]